MENVKYTLTSLLDIMTQLRDPEFGCPWDKQQTFASIVPHTIEEAYEVAQSIANEDWQELPSELGDLLFQIVFYAQLGKEQQRFNFDDVIERICQKLIRRHPHVFSEQSAQLTTNELNGQWERIKEQERHTKSQVSVLDDIPLALPALSRATKIQQRVARVGFDWNELSPVLAKIHEELDEVLAEVDPNIPDNPRLQEEVGDLLFAVVNFSRHLGVNPEQALSQANQKFERRFRGVEQQVVDSDKDFADHSLDTLDNYWNNVKRAEKMAN